MKGTTEMMVIKKKLDEWESLNLTIECSHPIVSLVYDVNSNV